MPVTAEPATPTWDRSGTRRREGNGERGLRPLALEGLFQSIAQSLTESWLSAYALLLGAAGPALGIVPSLPTAATAASQVLVRRASGRASRPRRFLAECWTLQGLGYAALGSCVVLPAGWSVAALCALVVVAFGSGGVAVPAWTALIARRARGAGLGRFFAARQTAQQAGVLLAILSGGMVLSAFRGRGLESAGFVLLFASAACIRLAGTSLLVAVPPETRPLPPRPSTGGLAALRSAPTFRRLAIHLWLLHLAAHVATPFFVPYMLASLHFSYVTIALLLAVPAAVKFLTLRLWGRVADRVGPGPLLRIAGTVVAIVPALWLVSGSPWWLLFAQVVSGLTWGAFELAQASALLRTTRGREGAIAMFHLVDGGAILTGSVLGGIVVTLAPGLGLPAYLTAIGASSILRAAPALTMLWRVRGIGRPGWSHLRLPLRLWAVRPSRGPSLRPWDLTPPDDREDDVTDERETAP